MWRYLLTALSAGVVFAGPCDAPEHRAFDFWLGDWNVFTPDGKQSGMNKIEKIHDGCALREQYQTTNGKYHGESLNIYDASRKNWHQTWVDNGGMLLQLDGGMREGSMVLEGDLIAADGKPVRQRVTWTPNADGTVRQHWESALPSGGWKTEFDGLYKRK